MRCNRLIYSAFLACLGATMNVTAAASETIRENQLGVEIVAADGSVFARYDLADRSRHGELRAYLEAEQGRNYGIRVRNYTGSRIGLVIAVDGRNIISGKKSNLRPRIDMPESAQQPRGHHGISNVIQDLDQYFINGFRIFK